MPSPLFRSCHVPCAARVVLAAATLASFVVSCRPPPETRAGWSVSGGFIRDPNGRAVIMRGVNLASAHKRKPYLGFHLQPDFDRVSRSWGMNAVRFLISWSGLEPEQGKIDAGYLDRVARRMDWAEAAGLLVVLDMHQDVYGEGFGGNGAPRWTCDEALYAAHKSVSPWFANYASPQVMTCFDRLWTVAALQRRFAEAWREVARRLGDHRAVVGFDVINEPHWGSANLHEFEERRLGPFYDRVISAVRSEAPGWIAFVEPSSSRNIGIPTRLPAPAHDDVVYAPHSYDPAAEQGRGFDPARRQAIIGNLKAMAGEAAALGAALWIGEYGGVASDKGITAYMDAQYDGAGAVAAGTMYWAYDRDSGYGALDPSGAEKKALLDVLVRPTPARVAGDPVSYGFDEATRTFTLRFLPNPSVLAPTEITVPARAYPKGYRVSAPGCAVETLTARVKIACAGAPAGPVTVSVQPW